jgi:hypothetical protein
VDFNGLQTNITAPMIEILMNWLVDVVQELNLPPCSLYLSREIITRILCIKKMERSQLQLLGVVAMFVACKYSWDTLNISAKSLTEITDDAYSPEEVSIG